MYRSEAHRDNQFDIYHIRSGANFTTELTVHMDIEDPRRAVYLGISHGKEPGIHWVELNDEKVDELLTVLMYAKVSRTSSPLT